TFFQITPIKPIGRRISDNGSGVSVTVQFPGLFETEPTFDSVFTCVYWTLPVSVLNGGLDRVVTAQVGVSSGDESTATRFHPEMFPAPSVDTKKVKSYLPNIGMGGNNGGGPITPTSERVQKPLFAE